MRFSPFRSSQSARLACGVFIAVLVTFVPAAAQTPQGAPPGVRFINPSTLSKPPGYTHVVEVTAPGRIIYIAGQVGVDRFGKVVGGPGDFRAQATQVHENLKAALESVGARFEDVVKLNTYLTDIRAQLPVLGDVRRGYFNTAAPLPASTTVEVSRLAREGVLIEIEAIAILPPR